MVIKVKEISIGRGRKWAWDYGNCVDYHVSITIEGTTVKDTVEDMIKRAIDEITPMETKEQDRCRFVSEGSTLLQEVEYKDKVEKPIKGPKDTPPIPLVDSKALPVVNEVISTPTVQETVIMTPNEVTMLVKTGLSMLVTKKGFQKWIPFSLMPEIDKDSYNPGEYIEIITIKDDKAKWFNEVKGWDKLEVRKG